MTTKISADRIRQIIKEEVNRARWYMVNEEAPVEEDEVIVELIDEVDAAPAEDADADADADGVSGKGLHKGRILKGRVSGAEYKVVSDDKPGGWNNIGDVEVEVHKYPKKKSAIGYKFKLSKLDSEHELYKNAVAANEEIPEVPSGDTAAMDAPEDHSKKAQMDNAGAESGILRGEKYLSNKGVPLVEKEFGWYKMKEGVPVSNALAKWLKLDPKDDFGDKRKLTDLVTHVRIVFNEKTTLTLDNIQNEGDIKVKWIQFKIARKGALKKSKDYEGSWNSDASALATYMLRGIENPMKDEEKPSDDGSADEGTLNESWKRIIG